MSYAELQIASPFSFLRGASHADELAVTAAALGLAAIGITDRNSFAGVVRAHAAAKSAHIRLVIGVRLDLQDGQSLLAWPMDRAAYGRLCRLLTLGKRRAAKGDCELHAADVKAHAEGTLFAALPPETDDPAFADRLQGWVEALPDRLYLAATHRYRGDDRARIRALGDLADRLHIPLLATNDVHYHVPARRPLADVMTCIREGTTLADAGYRLAANAERHLKSPAEMARLFRDRPDAIANTLAIPARCSFDLDELRYEYPEAPCCEGRTPQAALETLTWAGANARYPDGIPEKVRKTLIDELALVDQLNYAPYFLTVYDIVRHARSLGILCQGRGSAANSSVCYVLGITSVDPMEIDLLFARFISTERGEPPDIDVDFEHERREEVIQYIYDTYGRHRAGIAATVITYRSKSALREVAKVFGLSADAQNALSRLAWHGWVEDVDNRVREIGLDPRDMTLRKVLALANEIRGFPRHLSQHVGGFVITRGPLEEVCPIGNAAMADRTFIEWDKDDLDTLGILKIDILALGMLTCIRKCFDLIQRHHGRALTLANVPQSDRATYDMLCRADTIGVFQVESRAQMTMLPRLRPRVFYDLVIEVAIVRPGPIQGGMVHPYLKRRTGEEPIHFPAPDPAHGPPDELGNVLRKTMGVPLFQEQAMNIAIVAAGFTPGEADQLRRAMATFRRSGTIHTMREKFVGGMTRRGYDLDFADACFKQIEGFADYGFPESHAASFALLAYVSAWLKCHYPTAFACALLNSQPMGFYAPAQIVRDARDHGVRVLPVDVHASDWDSSLEGRNPALRLGFRQISGFREDWADAIMAARTRPFESLANVARRARLPATVMEKLALADAFGSLRLDRRPALWQARALADHQPDLFDDLDGLLTEKEAPPALPDMTSGEQVMEDYRRLRLSLKAHPMALLRPRFPAHARSRDLPDIPDGKRIAVAGLVLVRQRPGTASGVVFMTLEDETGAINVIVWPKLLDRFRRVVLGAMLIEVEGKLQKEGIVIHLVADRLADRTALLHNLDAETGPIEMPLSYADEVKHPPPPDARALPKSRDFC